MIDLYEMLGYTCSYVEQHGECLLIRSPSYFYGYNWQTQDIYGN
jgi:hypothetical protein